MLTISEKALMPCKNPDPIVEALKISTNLDIAMLERRAIENPDGPAARFLKWQEDAGKKH
jgi:hypothetical protein